MHRRGAFKRQLAAQPLQVWRLVSKYVLRPDHPFPLHKLLFQAVYAGWDAGARGPPPCWVPTPEGAAATNAAKFMRRFRVRARAC